jgi:hypothetical protein
VDGVPVRILELLPVPRLDGIVHAHELSAAACRCRYVILATLQRRTEQLSLLPRANREIAVTVLTGSLDGANVTSV